MSITEASAPSSIPMYSPFVPDLRSMNRERRSIAPIFTAMPATKTVRRSMSAR